ncbi:hypothetical protein ANCDUO_19959 [Ancylostoma duodenale]|uniref:Uncharacterized protein n=1 Tax=Ancylostoma duodenale TaxID=51022 RepID=A0A0C2FYS7_9BILA|nr:hypothetical protein ANCDUO_19959 [Ancylostoma duodenale]
MNPLRARVLFAQYLRGKRYKYGLELYKLCSVGGYTEFAPQKNTPGEALRKNRMGIPKDIISNEFRRGEVIARQSVSGITIFKWKEKEKPICSQRCTTQRCSAVKR